MVWNKYFIEFLGVTTIIYAKLLTEADPSIMAIIYFAMFSIAKGITTGYFTPIGSLASWMIGRIPTEEFMYNVVAQVLATVFVAITFLPIKTYMQDV
jgi:glycerol uptake facilitator-like aquaporin